MMLLGLEGIKVRFGGLTALDGVSLTAEAGRITGLIGPNGSGKTTLFNAISGLVRPTSGRVLLDGKDITRASAFDRARRGIGRTFQRLELFGSLPVRENVLVAAEFWSRRGDRGQASERAERALERVGLTDLAEQRADQLPTGHARLLEIARVLAGDPRLLLLDEPSSGLDDSETGELGELLGELAADGLGILLAEHDMSLVMAVSHTIHVLDLGRLIASAPPVGVRADEAVRAAYLGPQRPQAAARSPAVTVTGQPPALELQQVSAAYGSINVLDRVSLAIQPGQILALLGPNGAGKSTTLKVITGRLRTTRGQIRVLGHDVTGASPDALARAGICLVPDGNGVFPNLTVDEHLELTGYPGRRVPNARERAFAAFPRLAQRRSQLAGTLSGGEQRMLSAARALIGHSAVLLLDELSAGLSPQVLSDLYGAVREIADQGTAVLLVEQYAQQVLAIADVAALLIHGRIERYGAPAVVERDLVSAYLGDLARPRRFRPR